MDSAGAKITENRIQILHALVMGDDIASVRPTVYRNCQNVILGGRIKAIVYMPPEAKDVKGLMLGMISCINNSTDLACPVITGILDLAPMLRKLDHKQRKALEFSKICRSHQLSSGQAFWL